VEQYGWRAAFLLLAGIGILYAPGLFFVLHSSASTTSDKAIQAAAPAGPAPLSYLTQAEISPSGRELMTLGSASAGTASPLLGNG
jgi:predicted MFS family arabinose efflux permease